MALAELITHALAVGGGTLSQIVRPSDVNATKATRATTCSEDLYDKAVALAGFNTV